MTAKQALLLALRVLMETGVVAALAFWGFSTGDSAGTKLVLGLGAPIIGFGVWGAVDFHQAGRFAEPLRLLEELVISAVAALALVDAGQVGLGVGLALLSIVYHALVYVFGSTLLKPQAARRTLDPGRP